MKKENVKCVPRKYFKCSKTIEKYVGYWKQQGNQNMPIKPKNVLRLIRMNQKNITKYNV